MTETARARRSRGKLDVVTSLYNLDADAIAKRLIRGCCVLVTHGLECRFNE